MTYQIKDQNVTPPQPDPELQRSVQRDAAASVAMMFISLGLIAMIVAFQIL
ncbi:MAG: hypothetical protein ACO3C1_12160 [Ilumatobacteraceae bacterium]